MRIFHYINPKTPQTRKSKLSLKALFNVIVGMKLLVRNTAAYWFGNADTGDNNRAA